jgi:hypothetical protein
VLNVAKVEAPSMSYRISPTSCVKVTMQPSIQQFTLSLLAYKGALIEADERGSGILLGSELASVLGTKEYERLVFDPASNEAGAIRVDYDSPFFESAGRIADSPGSVVCLRALPELEPINPDRELERGLRLQNGILRIQECTRAEAAYICFLLRYDVMADERSGGIVEVWVNPEASSIPTRGTVLLTLKPAMPHLCRSLSASPQPLGILPGQPRLQSSIAAWTALMRA